MASRRTCGGAAVNWHVQLTAAPAEGSAARPLDRDFHLADLADRGSHALLSADPAGREHPQGPVAGRSEKLEAAVGAERYLGDELAARVQQPGVARRDRA